MKRLLLLAFVTCAFASISQCNFSLLNASVAGCEPGSVFDVTGSFEFDNSPATGTIVVEMTNGSGTFTQTFNSPFSNNTLYNFDIQDSPADGSPLTVTVYFSADPTCSIQVGSTSPANCTCYADIGTFTTTTNGSILGDTIVLYPGDTVHSINDGNFVPPSEVFNPPGPNYDPGIIWLMYSCPPSYGLLPTDPQQLYLDPCLLGVADTTELHDVHDFGLINAFPGLFNDSVIYFVPLTSYSIQGGIYSYVNTSIPCYSLGTPIPVQYLDSVVTSVTESCTIGTLSIQVSGGATNLNGGTFQASVVSPVIANVTQNNVPSGSSIIINGLSVGDDYIIDIFDGSGTTTVSGTFGYSDTATFNYPTNTFCFGQTPTMPTPTGGAVTFSTSDPDLTLYPFDGSIIWNQTMPGTYEIHGEQLGNCPNVWIDTITILPNDSTTINVNACGSYTSPTGQVYTSTGTYFEALSNVNGCDSVLVINLSVPLLDPSITVVGATMNANWMGASSYRWFDDNYNAIPGETSTAFSPSANGFYALEVSDGVCLDTSEFREITTVSVLELDLTDVILYPNPAQEVVYVSTKDQIRSIRLIDQTGRDVQCRFSGEQIYIAEIVKGVYIVMIEFESGAFVTRRLFKE